jgi:hypothetical protein
MNQHPIIADTDDEWLLASHVDGSRSLGYHAALETATLLVDSSGI